ncbi:Uncharacterised protein [Proteus mirabilis]|uniref:Uncharacterized protein n=1 Tax=Proteus mirabilis TaxID=584 RepID=A0A379GCL2_PROMI|nr:Uncharacterised protein [Proteus mirabilis]
MSYTLYLQQTPTVGTKVPFPSLAKGNYPLNEVIINAFLNLDAINREFGYRCIIR